MNEAIDVHAHFLPAGAIAAVDRQDNVWHGTAIERGPRGNPVFRSGQVVTSVYQSTFWQPPETRVQDLDATRVARQVVSLAPPLYRYFLPDTHGVAAAREVNDELASWCRSWPDRFLGLGALPLQAPAEAVRELERCMTDLGLAGAAVGTHVNGTNWDREELFPVLRAADELGAVLLFHPAEMRGRDAFGGDYQFPNLIGNPFETTTAIACLIFGGALDRLSAPKLIFSHGGGFACANAGRFDHGYQGRAAAREKASQAPSSYLRSLYFDCITHSELSLRYIIDTVGDTQVVLGSDYPADMGIVDPVRWVEGLGSITRNEQRKLLHENASRLFDLG